MVTNQDIILRSVSRRARIVAVPTGHAASKQRTTPNRLFGRPAASWIPRPAGELQRDTSGRDAPDGLVRAASDDADEDGPHDAPGVGHLDTPSSR